jgi:hypothetical protein
MTSKSHKALMKVSKRRQRVVEKLRDMYDLLAAIRDMIDETLIDTKQVIKANDEEIAKAMIDSTEDSP